jgi:hypothetical protein
MPAGRLGPVRARDRRDDSFQAASSDVVDGVLRFRIIADSAAASALLLPAVGDAKRKPLRGVERQLDDRSWVRAEVADVGVWGF